MNSDPVIERAHELVEKVVPRLGSTLWLNPPLSVGPPADEGCRFWQPHYPQHRALRAAGWVGLDPHGHGIWDLVILYASKHKDENWNLLAGANRLLAPHTGRLLFVVPNDYGSKSYQKGFQSEGSLIDYESGRKSRLYRLRHVPREGPSELDPISRTPAGYWTCPGLFSWRGPDRGSELLADCLEGERLRGPIADLGAGWGYLGTRLNPALPLHLFESDRRALECARRNLEGRALTTHWCDLSDVERWPSGAPTSFAAVVTNPPFHTGQREETALGQHFARLAHRLLSRGGPLWLVGNSHLGYPKLLATLFSSTEVRAQREGFTVVRATP